MTGIRLLNMQAESMVVAAINKGNNFDRAAKAFFRNANESGQESNAIIAYYTAINNAGGKPTSLKSLFFPKATLFETVTETLETSAKKCKELQCEFIKFHKSLKNKYPKTVNDRISLAFIGAVRADKVHRHSPVEKFFWKLDKNFARLIESLMEEE